MIYLMIFAFSAFCSARSQTAFAYGRKWMGRTWSLPAVLVPAMFGGLRSVLVGTDNLTYQSYFLAIRNTSSLLSALRDDFMIRANVDPLFIALNFLVSRFTGEYFWLTVSASLITVFFVYLAAYHARGKYDMWLVMFVYYTMYFCQTWNLVRQGIALSIVLYALHHLHRRQWWKHIFWLVVATGFHVSALTAFLLPVVVLLSERVSRTAAIVVVVSVVLIAALPGGPIVRLISIFRPVFAAQIGPDAGVPFSLSFTLYLFPFILLFSLLYRYSVAHDAMSHNYYVFLWLQLIFSQFAGYFAPAARLGLYFGYPIVFLIAGFVRLLEPIRSNRLLGTCAVVASCVAYWYVLTVLNYYGFARPVYPYFSDVLGIH